MALMFGRTGVGSAALMKTATREENATKVQLKVNEKQRIIGKERIKKVLTLANSEHEQKN